MNWQALRTTIQSQRLVQHLQPYAQRATAARLRGDPAEYMAVGREAAVSLRRMAETSSFDLHRAVVSSAAHIIGYEEPIVARRAAVIPWSVQLGISRNMRWALFSGARDALQQALSLQELSPGSAVLLPAYICNSVTQSIEGLGLQPRFYGLDTKLQVDIDSFRSVTTPDVGAALFVNYFGIGGDFADALSVLRAQAPAAVSMYDCAQSLYAVIDAAVARQGFDYVVTSHRKFSPLPDSALLLACNDTVPLRPSFAEQSRPSSFLKLVGRLLRAQVWEAGAALAIDALACDVLDYAEAQMQYEPGIYPASPASLHLLTSMNFDYIRETRREHAAYLQARLPEAMWAFDTSADADVRGVYVRVSKPHQVRDALARQGIWLSSYASPSWRVDSRAEATAAAAIADATRGLLRLNIDAAYDVTDMEYQLRALLE